MASDHHRGGVVFILIFACVEIEASRSSFFSKVMQLVCVRAKVKCKQRTFDPWVTAFPLPHDCLMLGHLLPDTWALKKIFVLSCMLN